MEIFFLISFIILIVHLGLPTVLLEDVFTVKLLPLVRNYPRQFEQQPANGVDESESGSIVKV